MKINSIYIKKFRGFEEVGFSAGKKLTIIAGQNGTQKTTLLGLLCQPFSLDSSNAMRTEKPLSGGNYISDFSNKFRISHNIHDKAGEHEWTLEFNDEEISSFTLESIYRDKTKGTIRFWKKGDKTAGSGYPQMPVIYLSLKRLLPIGEDLKLAENTSNKLDQDEFELYSRWHNKILILTREKDKITHSSILESNSKDTIGANTSYYDWQTNSAGQDNIGKILLAILSFRRLKAKYPSEYKGGILAIDEIDTTFYPGSQVELLNAIVRFASEFDIQIFVTTHSLTILEEASKKLTNPYLIEDIRLIYLIKEDNHIAVKDGIDFAFIKNHLNVVTSGGVKKHKIDTYTEDKEGAEFAKCLLGPSITTHLNFIDVSLGCSNLEQLCSKKVPSFIFPNSIIILDGDGRTSKRERLKNMKFLPTNKSPEQILSEFLNGLSDTSNLWSEIDITFNHTLCFKDYSNEQIQNGISGGERAREIAKKWYNSHIGLWGRNGTKVWKYWKAENMELVNEFKSEISTLIQEIQN